MKKTACPLVLCTVLLVLVGFALPWTVSFWQDRALADQVQTYETAPVNLQSDASLFRHLQLVADGYTVLDLVHRPSTALTTSQCRTLAFEGLQALADEGLTLFDPDQWTWEDAYPFMAVASGTKVSVRGMPPGKIDPEDRSTLEGTSAAIFWDCSLTSKDGQILELTVDDIGGKILSFFLVDSEEAMAEPDKVQSFPQETADLLASFCRQYYGMSVEMPYMDVGASSCSLALEDDSGRKTVLSLLATTHSLVFNDSNIQHAAASPY